MPKNNINIFSNNNDSANDHIQKIKAKAIYQVASSNITNKETNSNVPIKTSSEYCKNNYKILRNVGGFNVNSYELLLDVTKGRYYTANTGRYATIESANSNKKSIAINDCSKTVIELDKNNYMPITTTYNTLENNMVLINNSNNINYNDCDSEIIKNIKIDEEIIKHNNGLNYLARFIENDPLRGFKFPETFSMLDKS